jgi:hypothetical protein
LEERRSRIRICNGKNERKLQYKDTEEWYRTEQREKEEKRMNREEEKWTLKLKIRFFNFC